MKKRTYDPRICLNPKCGIEFIPNGGNQNFCCAECRKTAYKLVDGAVDLSKTRICPVCERRFYPKNSRHLTCTSECRKKYNKLHHLNEYKYSSKRDLLEEEEKPKKPDKIKPGTRAWKNASPYRRMDCMSLSEVQTECRNRGITYRDAQIMYYGRKLPDDFGRSLKRIE